MPSRFSLFVTVIVLSGCAEPTLESTVNIQMLNARVQALGDSLISPGDTCTRIHHLWRDQLRLSLSQAGRSSRQRRAAFIDSVYRPHRDFWDGYVGGEDEFTRRVARRWVDLEHDPRASIPVDVDVAGLIVETNRVAAALAGRSPRCADWYLIYGPGMANMGGLSSGEMLVDFFGFSDSEQDLRIYVPHEAAHVLYGGRRADPQDGTLLSSMLSEGFATYFSVLFHAGTVSPAGALGYSAQEWDWAVENERALWDIVKADLDSRDEDLIRRFRAAGERVRPDAPGKIGYFIGYRILESYVRRHGTESWADFFELPLRDILSRSGYPDAGSATGPMPGTPAGARVAQPAGTSCDIDDVRPCRDPVAIVCCALE